ncbi:T9SS type A sorting domain-containing protein [bacterium]|nr:T9SS type A sorting domain-containing protein [bacterium]
MPGSVWAQADPRNWPDDPPGNVEPGIPIRQGHHIEWQRASYVNDAGQVLVVWSDTRHGDRDVYAQMINPDGSLGFGGEAGIPISAYENRQEDPDPVAVTGGWIIAWIEFRNDTTGDIYAKKIDINGETWPGWDENGNIVDVLSNSAVIELSVRAVHDGNGGAIVAWEDLRGAGGDIYAQHINSDGTTSWAQPLAVTTVEGEQFGITADTDGAGNMVLAWNDNRNASDQNIYAAKITPSGDLPWGSGPNGILVCNAAFRQKSVKLCSDLATGGCYLAWVDERTTGNDNLFMQRIDGNGNILWGADGLMLCNAPDKQSGVRVTPDMMPTGQVGVLTVWEDSRENGLVNEVYAQKTSAAGAHQWTPNGEFVCGNAGPDGTGDTRDGARLTSDLAGGSLITWDDTRNSNGNILFYDLYTARLSSAGQHLWGGECGVLVCDGLSAQQTGVLRMMSSSVVCEVFDDESRGSITMRYKRLNVSDGSGIDADCGPELVFGLDGDATEPESIEMDRGTVAVVWEDGRGRNLGKAIFYQAVDTNQVPMLPVNGDTLCPDNEGRDLYAQSDHDLASDGNHGFFVSFIDLRTGVKQVRLTRVNNEAETVCSRAGVVVKPSILDQQSAFVCPDGSGGCFVGWSENDFSFSLDVYVQRFDENCEEVWTEPVRLTSDGMLDDVLRDMIVSTDGCCFLFWEYGVTAQLDILGARICADGTVSWQGPVCTSPRRQANPSAAADNNGGVFIAWSDKRVEENLEDIYAQYLDATGTAQWAADGIIVNSTINLQDKPRLSVDADDNVYIMWEDFRSGTNLDLYGQKLDANGNLLWSPFGEVISDEPGDQQDHQLLVDCCNGLYAAWTDERGFYQGIYGTHATSDAEFTLADEWWSGENDGVICNWFQNQSNPTLSSDGAVGTICCWVDWRSSGKEPLQNIWGNWVTDRTCICIEAVSAGVTMPQEYSLSQNYPNPFNPSTQFEFSIPKQERVEIALYNTLGQQVMTLVDEAMTAGTYRVSLDASRLSSGVYFCQMQTPSFKQVRKMMLVR